MHNHGSGCGAVRPARRRTVHVHAPLRHPGLRLGTGRIRTEVRAGTGEVQAAELERLIAAAYDAPPPSRYARDADIDEDDRAAMVRATGNTQGDKAFVYGEITFQGAEQLAAAIRPRRDDAFYDLGSGYGRLVLQAHLSPSWGVASSIGVELSQARHDAGARALARLANAGATDQSRDVQLVHGNLLRLDVSPATIVYLACTMWDDIFCGQVLIMLAARAHRIRCLVSTEDLEARFGLELPPGWRKEREVTVTQTWADDCTLYVYAMDPLLY